MSTHPNEQTRPAVADETSPPRRRGIIAGIGALVAGGLGLFSLHQPAKADDDDGWDDDGYHGGYYYDPYYHGGYYYDPYWGGYYYDDWDDDDGWDDDWDD